jgi:hypothetical protein
MSIVIVGVGRSNFHKMKIFDGDSGGLRKLNKNITRDIVQFVSYNDFKNDPDQLARKVLLEVP